MTNSNSFWMHWTMNNRLRRLRPRQQTMAETTCLISVVIPLRPVTMKLLKMNLKPYWIRFMAKENIPATRLRKTVNRPLLHPQNRHRQNLLIRLRPAMT